MEGLSLTYGSNHDLNELFRLYFKHINVTPHNVYITSKFVCSIYMCANQITWARHMWHANLEWPLGRLYPYWCKIYNEVGHHVSFEHILQL
jgi:hypothetical protein